MLATHRVHRTIFAGSVIDLQPGQLITSRSSLSLKTTIHPATVERILTIMISEQQIEQRTSNLSRLITILNWNRYQFTEQQIEQQPNNNRTTIEQPPDTNKNVKNEENGRISPLVLPFGDEITAPTPEEIYDLYPHKVGKPSALKAIRKALKSHNPAFLKEKTAAYAEAVKGTDTILPNPATWFNDERFENDPSTWARRNGKPVVKANHENGF